MISIPVVFQKIFFFLKAVAVNGKLLHLTLKLINTLNFLYFYRWLILWWRWSGAVWYFSWRLQCWWWWFKKHLLRPWEWMEQYGSS